MCVTNKTDVKYTQLKLSKDLLTYKDLFVKNGIDFIQTSGAVGSFDQFLWIVPLKNAQYSKESLEFWLWLQKKPNFSET